MNNSILKKFALLFLFLAGIGIGAGGLWLAIQNINELRYFLLDHPTGNLPQEKTAAFIQSILQGDETAALELWQISDITSPEKQDVLEKRRTMVISDLLAAGINPEYTISGIEWWTTCCEPNVTQNARNAGGARIKVQFLDKNGQPLLYTFDVFTLKQPYWADAQGYPPRNWVIRDVYSAGKNPLFWTLVYTPQIQSVQPSEP